MWTLLDSLLGRASGQAANPAGSQTAVRLTLYYSPYDRGTRYLLEQWSALSSAQHARSSAPRLTLETVDCAAEPTDGPHHAVTSLPAAVLVVANAAPRAIWEGDDLDLTAVFDAVREVLADD